MTEDGCFGRSNSENKEGSDGAIHAYHGKTRFSTEGLEDVSAVVEKPFQDQDLVASLPEGSLGLLRMNYKKKNLSKQSFVPKAILHW